jgi:hypothetical protein
VMRCPVCKADNSQGPQCRRCKADLTLLFDLEEQRRRMLTGARNCLARGQWAQAIDQAEDADWMRSDLESQQLLAVAYLLNRDFERAWECYQMLEPT